MENETGIAFRQYFVLYFADSGSVVRDLLRVRLEVLFAQRMQVLTRLTLKTRLIRDVFPTPVWYRL